MEASGCIPAWLMTRADEAMYSDKFGAKAKDETANPPSLPSDCVPRKMYQKEHATGVMFCNNGN
jgi:hypothetical protein